MLVPKQWTRIVGGLVAAIVFLLMLKGFHDYRPYREVLETVSQKFETSQPTSGEGEEATAASHPVETSTPTTASSMTMPTTFKLKPSDAIVPPPAKVSLSQSGDAISTPPVEVPQTQSEEFGLPDDHITPQKPTSITNGTSSSETSPQTAIRKAVVMGKMTSEDTDWVGQELVDWERSIYVVDLPEDEDSPTGLKTKMNKANEAIPYLTYIVENYANFPDVAVFIHAHRAGWPKAWHNDAPNYDAVNMLRGLHLPVVQERGFVNLRCMGSPGCPREIQLNRFPVDEEKTAEIAYPYIYGDFFNMTVEDVRQQVPIVATPCCAQFAVSKEQVWQWPKSEYERWLRVIEDSEVESHTLGTVLEYMWHIMFGREAIHCEHESACRAALYGYGSPGNWHS